MSKPSSNVRSSQPATRFSFPLAYLFLLLAVLFVILLTTNVGIWRKQQGIHLGNFLENLSKNKKKSNNTRPFLKFIESGKIHSVGAGGSDPKSTCVIFSCSAKGYFLLEPSLKASKAKQCDRIHYSGTTFNRKGKKTTAHWCRVALLLGKKLDRYKTIMYVDVDVVFNETSLIETGEKYHNKILIISKKYEKKKDILRTCWFVLPNISKAKRLITKWAKNWKNVHLQDQNVFNKLWRCSTSGIQCLEPNENYPELRHCGSYLKGNSRVECLKNPKTFIG